MDNTVFYIVLCFLLPTVMLCLYLEKRARRIMISFCCGVLACSLAYNLNTLLGDLLSVKTAVYAVFGAPLVEELLKFIPILLIALLLNKGRRGSTANAYAVGIGFCLVENVFYLLAEQTTATALWIVSRSIGAGLMHGMSATLMGLGIYMARKRNKHTVLLIVGTFFLAVIYHGLFNFLVQQGTVLRVIGVLLPMVTYLSIFAFVKKEDLRRFLSEETRMTEEVKDGKSA